MWAVYLSNNLLSSLTHQPHIYLPGFARRPGRLKGEARKMKRPKEPEHEDRKFLLYCQPLPSNPATMASGVAGRRSRAMTSVGQSRLEPHRLISSGLQRCLAQEAMLVSHFLAEIRHHVCSGLGNPRRGGCEWRAASRTI